MKSSILAQAMLLAGVAALTLRRPLSIAGRTRPSGYSTNPTCSP
jgi:hypothetical protein